LENKILLEEADGILKSFFVILTFKETARAKTFD
jgi:hypothetical protein